MAYDPSKDILIQSKEILNDTTRVAIFSYNGGAEKICVQEKGSYRDKNTGEEVSTWVNLKGRKSKEDYYIIGKTIIEMINDK